MTAGSTDREHSLPEKVLAVHDALASARIKHAFGGALALAYYAEPRATIDIDLNVFLAPDRVDSVVTALDPLGVDTRRDPVAVQRDGQCRFRWGRTPIDLFFAYDQLHREMQAATRAVSFAQGTIPILSPDHLLVCKAVFDRPKDWLDIEQMLVAGEALDRAEIERCLIRMVGADSEQLKHFDSLADNTLGH